MSVLECLQRAQKLLEPGVVDFSPCGSCQRKDGSYCEHDDEGVHTFSVEGALRAVASSPAELEAARQALEATCSPAWAECGRFWMALPGPADREDWWREHPAETRTAHALMCAAFNENVNGLDEWLKRATLKGVLGLFDLTIACSEAA